MDDLEQLDDAELLASLEAQESIQGHQSQAGPDSGYGTLDTTSAQSSNVASVRSLVPAASDR